MAKKRIFMSVTATAAIASAFVAAEEVDAASHKVQSGDSLWAIAQKYNTSVSQLKKINNLSGDIIYPNQIIQTVVRTEDVGSGSGAGASESAGSSGSSGSAGSSSDGDKDVPSPVESSTYTVKRGDTLSRIAAQHKISLSDLMKWNNLETTLIFPGNVFVVSEPGATGVESGARSDGNSGANENSGSNDSTADQSKPAPAPALVYTVKSGDTLSHIARRNGVTVANLKKWNNLSSDLIFIGQKLNIGEKVDTGSGSGDSASEKPTADVSYNVDQLISEAKSLLGVPYAWGGQTPNGFDCSGFIHYVYNLAGMETSRLSTDGYYSRSYEIDKPQIGDLVFFSGTYRAGISHMGIYLGNNEFIHAGTSTGVTISNLNETYWTNHFDSFKRFY